MHPRSELVYNQTPFFAFSFRSLLCSNLIVLPSRCAKSSRGGSIILRVVLEVVESQKATCQRRRRHGVPAHVIVAPIAGSHRDSEANGWNRDTILCARVADKSTTGTAIMLVPCLLSLAIGCTSPSEAIRTAAACIVFVKCAPFWGNLWGKSSSLYFQEAFIVAFRRMVG